VSFIRRRGQSDGQPRCTKQREKETEEKRSQADVSTGEARDSLQANAAGPDATYRTDKAVESGATGACGLFSPVDFLVPTLETWDCSVRHRTPTKHRLHHGGVFPSKEK